jgi:8-oxo-dGTP pyrophosphatase MutT (NUDIX family)
MNESLIIELKKTRADWVLRNQFFSYGRVGLLDGFTLSRSDPFGESAELFQVGSAGTVVLTYSPMQTLSVLLVNEEEERWDIPSGRVEASDVSPAATAQRELGEETPWQLELASLLPLSYAVSPKSKAKAGVQFFAVAASPAQLQAPAKWDAEGRVYYRFEAAEGNLNLALEPLDLFLSAGTQSLLAQSHHPWAYRLTRAALMEKVRLAREAGYLN